MAISPELIEEFLPFFLPVVRPELAMDTRRTNEATSQMAIRRRQILLAMAVTIKSDFL